MSSELNKLLKSLKLCKNNFLIIGRINERFIHISSVSMIHLSFFFPAYWTEEGNWQRCKPSVTSKKQNPESEQKRRK